MAALQEAIEALRAGKRAEAQALLAQVIKQDPKNEQAWLWLSQAVESDAQRRVCLERVLQINPDNPAAQRGLRHLQKPEAAAPTGSSGAGAAAPAAERRAPTTLERVAAWEAGPSAPAGPPERAAAPGARPSAPAGPPGRPATVGQDARSAAPAAPERQMAPGASPSAPAGWPALGYGARIVAQRMIGGLARSRPIAWLRTKVQERTGIALGETASVALVTAGVVILLLLAGLVIDREATGNCLRGLISLAVTLAVVVVVLWLVAAGIGWLLDKTSRGEAPGPAAAANRPAAAPAASRPAPLPARQATGQPAQRGRASPAGAGQAMPENRIYRKGKGRVNLAVMALVLPILAGVIFGLDALFYYSGLHFWGLVLLAVAAALWVACAVWCVVELFRIRLRGVALLPVIGFSWLMVLVAPVALLILASIPSPWQCPYCREYMKEGAIKCPHCQADLGAADY